MKFFRASKNLLTWQEPILFAARIRNRRGWMLRGLLAALICGVMLFGMYADRNWGGRGPKFSIAGGVLLSAFIGLFLTSLLDASDLNRQITISDDNISSFGNAGHHVSMTTWPLRDLFLVRLIPPEEFGRSFGAMELRTKKGVALVGVPRKMAMPRIAEVLHSQGIPVQLPGWEPKAPEPETETALAAEPRAATAERPAVMPTASARIERLDELESGRILSPFTFRVSLTMALGPLLVSLVVGIALFAVTFYRLRIARMHGSLADLAILLGALALIVGGFWYTARFANLVPSLFIRSVARSVIEMRPGALFNSRDPEAIYIDVVPRANWGKAMIKEFTDTGLLKVDELSRSLLFEGDQERWAIPAASLVSVEVESYWGAGHIEGQEGGDRFYVTVIRANAGGEVWEAPVWKCHVELKPKDNRLRETNALALRDQIRTLRPALADTAGVA